MLDIKKLLELIIFDGDPDINIRSNSSDSQTSN